jgi:hypothetical protein
MTGYTEITRLVARHKMFFGSSQSVRCGLPTTREVSHRGSNLVLGPPTASCGQIALICRGNCSLPAAFHQKHMEIRGQRLSVELPHHQCDLTSMVGGMVRQMLHQVRQSDLCFSKRQHCPKIRLSHDSRTRFVLLRLPSTLTAPQRRWDMHPVRTGRPVLFSNQSRMQE